jgi:peptide/nickel transport system permease protein
VTLLGLIVRKVIGGAVVIEVLFAIPGMGRFLVDSVVFKDSDAILGIVVVLAVGVVMINTLIEISYAFLDPRIRQA